MAKASTMTLQDWGLSGFEKLGSSWSSLMGLGLFLIMLGCISVCLTGFAGVVSTAIIGLFFVAGGITQIVHGFSSRGWGGILLHICLGILYVVAGGILIANPLSGLATLTFVMAAFFIASGIIRASSSILTRFPAWGWSFVSGLVSIALGSLVINQWPNSSMWFIGLYIGIDLIFIGCALASLGAAARRIAFGYGARTA